MNHGFSGGTGRWQRPLLHAAGTALAGYTMQGDPGSNAEPVLAVLVSGFWNRVE